MTTKLRPEEIADYFATAAALGQPLPAPGGTCVWLMQVSDSSSDEPLMHNWVYVTEDDALNELRRMVLEWWEDYDVPPWESEETQEAVTRVYTEYETKPAREVLAEYFEANPHQTYSLHKIVF